MKKTFIDLFAGIGGFRQALESLGMKCVFSSEINPHACQIYELNYLDNPLCDITKKDAKSIVDFDILCGGFPCQAFSIAGKKLGFEDTRGTLFFDIARIVAEKKPSVVLLENVKNLLIHDKGNTFKKICNTLEELGYYVSYKLLNANQFNVPQNRERIIIVATKIKPFDFSKVQISNKIPTIAEILEPESDNQNYLNPSEYTLLDKVDKNTNSNLVFCGYLNKTIRKGVDPKKLHLSRTHRQPNRIYRYDGCHPTLSSQESAGRYFVLLPNNKVRKLTINECFSLMGFPKDFKLIGSQSNLNQRIGNSVCIPMIKAVMEEIIKQFDLEK